MVGQTETRTSSSLNSKRAAGQRASMASMKSVRLIVRGRKLDDHVGAAVELAEDGGCVHW